MPMPRFWIWYTGCVGLCPSFSPLGGAGVVGGGGVVPSGVEAVDEAAGPFPSSRGFIRTMGFSSGAGAGGAAGVAAGAGCFDYGGKRDPVGRGDPVPWRGGPLGRRNPMASRPEAPSLLTRSAGGLERMMGVFCMTAVLVSSLPSYGEGKRCQSSASSAHLNPPTGMMASILQRRTQEQRGYVPCTRPHSPSGVGLNTGSRLWRRRPRAHLSPPKHLPGQQPWEPDRSGFTADLAFG